MKRFQPILILISAFLFASDIPAAEFQLIEPALIQRVNLRDVVLQGIANNLDLKQQAYLSREAEAGIGRAKGIYDFHLDSTTSYSHDKREPLFIFASSKKISFDSDTHLSRLFPTGTTLSLGWLQQWEENSFSATFNTLNPYWQMGFELKLTQPLLKNAFGFVTRRSIEQAKLAWQSASHVEKMKLEGTVAEIEAAFWELSHAAELYEIKKKGVEQADKLHEYNVRQSERGIAEKVDLFASEAHAETRRGELIAAEGVLIQAGKRLKSLLDDVSPLYLLPSDRMLFSRGEALRYQTESNKRILDEALKKRFDLKAMKEEAENAQLTVEIARNGRLPQLNLMASVTSTGLDKSYNNSIDKSAKYEKPVYFIGGTLFFPLENREARYALKEAMYGYQRAEIRAAQLEHEIALEIERLSSQIRATELAIENLLKAEELLNKKLSERERQFRMGRVPLQLVIDDQEHLLVAQTHSAEAIKNYKILETEWNLAQHSLAEKYGIRRESGQ
ncbi:MAG: TolC family protein [Deltaproteobacteria bacterium]|nr:TolC family protein [Deltaproteobacteria bacterium]